MFFFSKNRQIKKLETQLAKAIDWRDYLSSNPPEDSNLSDKDARKNHLAYLHNLEAAKLEVYKLQAKLKELKGDR